MARKQCYMVCPLSGNMARKQCFMDNLFVETDEDIISTDEDIISTDEDSGLRIESFAVINVCGVSTNKKYYIL